MKKTQKLLSLVVVLALALSVCSLSASAKKIISSTTIDENLITADFETASTYKANTAITGTTGTNSLKGGGAVNGSIADGVLKFTGRSIVNLNTPVTTGTYSVKFRFMTPDTAPAGALSIFRCGIDNNFTSASEVVTTIANSKDTVGTITIEPSEWYDFEAIIDLDSDTGVASIEGTTVKEFAFTAANLGRILDVPVSGRNIHYDDLVVNKITQNYIEDGVTNVMTEDFSSMTSITTSTRFKDASGSTNFNKASDAVSKVSVVDGKMLVGTVGTDGVETAGGRFILNPDPVLNSGTYSVSFDFMKPEVTAGANTYIFEAQNSTTGGFGTLIHYPTGNDEGHIWVNGASAMEFTEGQWYEYDATFEFTTKSYVVTINDQKVQSGTFTASQFTRLFHASQAAGDAIYYDNIVINKITKDYEVMNVTKADGTIKARFVSNAAPKATFFAAIYENDVLTSLKAISNVTNLEEKTVGTYTADDADVEVKFYVWAKNGLMPLTDAE